MTPTRPIDEALAAIVGHVQSAGMAINGDRLDTGILELREIRQAADELERRLQVQLLANGVASPTPERYTHKPRLEAAWIAGVEAAFARAPRIYKHASYDQHRPHARAYLEGYDAAADAMMRTTARRRLEESR